MALIFFVTAFATFWSGGALSHAGNKVYLLHQLPTGSLPDLHDGTLADWQSLFGQSFLTEEDFVSDPGVGEGAPIGGPDLSANIYLGWTPSPGRIYAAIERLDNAYINAYKDLSTPIWHYDSVEFNVDGDHSGGEYAFLDDLTFCAGSYEDHLASQSVVGWACGDINWGYQAQSYHAIAQAPLGVPRLRLYVEEEAGFSAPPSPYTKKWAQVLPYADVGGVVTTGTPHRSVIELMITPFDTLDVRGPTRSKESVLELGKIIGLQITLPDFDSSPFPDYHGFSTLEGQSSVWRNADHFVDFLLVGPSESPSHVEEDLWGRIKASFSR